MAAATSIENDLLRVDVSVDPTLDIRITDKRNGFVWSCPEAPFALHYWEAAHFAAGSCPTDHAHGWEFRLLPDEERIGVQCMWPRAAFGFRAELHLDETMLGVLLAARRLVENRPFDVRQMAIDVFPGLGAARTGEKGFLLIPRERGALCRFDKSGRHETARLVYSGGDQGLTAPVFGVARDGAALLGIISQGEFDAELVLTANVGPERDRNGIHPRLRMRLQSADPLADTDSRLRYTFLVGDDASYVGMANAYRKYLVDVCGHPCLGERAKVRTFLDAARRGPAVHVLLGEKRRRSRMTGDGELEVKTRFADVAGIARGMQDAGIETATVVLCGWNCEGKDGLYPTRFPVESELGGADAMSEALAAVRELGYQVGALDNYTDMYRRSPAFHAELSARQLGGEPWRGGIWAGGQSYVICPREARERHAQRDMRRLYDLGMDGLLFLDHFPGPGVLRCYADEHPLTRREYAEQMGELVRMAQSVFGMCRVSGLAVFAALAADSCVCPVHDLPAIDTLEPEWFVDETVPFLPIALHGIVLLAAEVDRDPLRAVEYGAVPIYHTSAADFPHLLPSLAAFSRRYAAELAPLASEFIVSHDRPGDGLTRVGYSGGAAVLINRTDQPAEIDGVVVEPQDFQVKR